MKSSLETLEFSDQLLWKIVSMPEWACFFFLFLKSQIKIYPAKMNLAEIFSFNPKLYGVKNVCPILLYIFHMRWSFCLAL